MNVSTLNVATLYVGTSYVNTLYVDTLNVGTHIWKGMVCGIGFPVRLRGVCVYI